MTKLSKQDRIDIYNNWKYYDKSIKSLSQEYNTALSTVRYLIKRNFKSVILNRKWYLDVAEFCLNSKKLYLLPSWIAVVKKYLIYSKYSKSLAGLKASNRYVKTSL